MFNTVHRELNLASAYQIYFCGMIIISHTSSLFRTNVYGFFTALTNMIFMFGAHTAVIEKAVKMDNPDLYDRAYYFATVYVYVITVPAGITGYHTFGIEAAKTGNAFYLLERSPAQLVAASLMCIHEWVAFGLFVGEL